MGPAPRWVCGVYQIIIRVADDASSGVLPLVIRPGGAASPDEAAPAMLQF